MKQQNKRPIPQIVPILALTLLAPLLLSRTEQRPQAAQAQPQQPPFADPTFRQVWERTDAPVLAGRAQRSWYWGPQPGKTLSEPYAGGAGGTRLVQYFDKARMEINNPSADRKSEWFVTTGLLVAEMVSGKQQVGDKEFKPLRPAEIAVAGDGLGTDPDAPTYTSFRRVASITVPGANRAPKLTGQNVTATLSRAGAVSDNPALGLYKGAKLAAYNDVLGHNIPQAMWDFLNLKGVVQQNGVALEGQTIANWVSVAGYPITEPYWARIQIGGVYYDALIQLYERRSLVYIPSFAPGWQVQMGNVGQHYERWLYGGPLPAPLAPIGSPQPLPPDIPVSVHATVSVESVPVGSPIGVEIEGFRASEGIVSWFTSPEGKATDARIALTAGPDGTARNITVQTAGLSPGVWAITFHGKASNHEAIAYFHLYAAPPATPSSTPMRPTQPPTGGATLPPASPTRTQAATRTPPRATSTPTTPRGTPTPAPTFPPVPTLPAGGLLLAVRPGSGPPDGQFTFTAYGLAPGEPVSVKFTDPTRVVVYPAGSNNGQLAASPEGRVSFTLVPTQTFPAAPTGVWLFELKGERSGLEGVIGFTLR